MRIKCSARFFKTILYLIQLRNSLEIISNALFYVKSAKHYYHHFSSFKGKVHLHNQNDHFPPDGIGKYLLLLEGIPPAHTDLASVKLIVI